MVDSPGIELLGPCCPPRALAWLGLARAAVQARDRPRAHAAYDAALQRWQTGDADLPQLVEARRERASLR